MQVNYYLAVYTNDVNDPSVWRHMNTPYNVVTR